MLREKGSLSRFRSNQYIKVSNEHFLKIHIAKEQSHNIYLKCNGIKRLLEHFVNTVLFSLGEISLWYTVLDLQFLLHLNKTHIDFKKNNKKYGGYAEWEEVEQEHGGKVTVLESVLSG